jgi:hypothetical protein
MGFKSGTSQLGAFFLSTQATIKLKQLYFEGKSSPARRIFEKLNEKF